MREPIYIGKRNFLGWKDLVISFYTKKCQFDCSFCGLKQNSSDEDVSDEDIVNQFEIALNKYDNLESFTQLSIGNEGSILDRQRFSQQAFDKIIQTANQRLPNLDILSLETRPEYITRSMLEKVMKKTQANKVDLTIGFETQDDELRNGVLNKKMKKQSLEKKIALLGEMGVRLTSYVMLKPGPDMTEEEGIDEATATIQYLSEKCSMSDTELVIYLNPTYRVEGSKLEKEMIEKDYRPPMIQSVLLVLTETRHCGVRIYTGLSSEGLSDVDYTSREGYDSRIPKAIRRFNSTQDYEHLYIIQREWMMKLPA